MREIKFRIWDKSANWMILHEKINYSILQLQEEDKRFKLMQYTGLKDKNGVEIYEGDIVIDWEYLSKYKVIWNNKWACFELECIKTISDTTIEMDDLHTCKVIGNIYENKELLK